MRTHRTIRALASTALGLTLAVTLAACGDNEPDGGSQANGQSSATEHNDADVAFASDMLQHHAQALSMVDLTRGRPLDPEVEQLAEQIRDAQAPEIETFSEWLTGWDEAVPETMRDHVNADQDGADSGDSMAGMDSTMPGMMSADDMTALGDATDAEFQTMWLQMMIDHHTGALDMATSETEDGRYRPAIDLANDIIASQTQEIDTMKGLVPSS